MSKNLAVLFVAGLFGMAAMSARSEELPDALVKRVSQEVVELAKNDKEIQAGNQKRVLDLVESKVIPHVNFEHMTALATGRFWREATDEQQKRLTSEFRQLLVYTYSGAIAQIKDQKIEFKPMRGEIGDTRVEVRSRVILARGGEPMQLDYRLEKTPSGWVIYDMNILGAWLVETYKANFASEISRTGLEGLIRILAEKNKKLAIAKASKVL